MKHEETIVTETSATPAAWARRISWGAVFAGLIITLAFQVMLTILGVAVGAATLEPMSGQGPGKGMALGAGIWMLASSLVALFVGGCVAGRLAGIPRREDGGLHGLITWGSATLVALALVTTAIGGLIGGAMGMLGQTMAALGPSAGQAAQQAQAQGSQRGMNMQALREEVRSLLPQTGPSSAEARQAAEEIQRERGAAAQNPQVASQELTAALDRLFSQPGGQANPQAREAVTGILVSRYNMSQEEANRAVSRWEQRAQATSAGGASGTSQAREIGEKVASGTAQTAFWGFIAMLLGAAVAYWGGLVGAPRGTRLAYTETRAAATT